MARTTVFISSVNEDGLKPLRRAAFRELVSLGHDPLMWEENLGPWPAHIDSIKKCLEAVEACDIYLLFLGSKSGTYNAPSGITVTHMEFIKAHEQGKLILVFADTEIKSVFFTIIKPLIDQFIDQYINDEERFPSPLHIMDFLSANHTIPSNVEPYVWYFLYDMTLRKIYIDDLSLGVPIDWKAYFSDLLRRGSLLLPLEQSIEQTSIRLEQFDEAVDLLYQLIPQLEITGLQQSEEFLEIIKSRMAGGRIEHSYGSYVAETVGFYGDCCAATLYRQEDDYLRLVAKVGSAAGAACYKLDDHSSYNVLTYHMGDQEEQVFFKASKNMFYYCIRTGNLVLTLHFPADPDWDYKKFIHYKEAANDAIISKNPLMIEFIKLILGGMQS
ncbi:DUF4062 domain-containing protein [Paenibacillus woosongensis]|uniref:DUF4062 domain-containing protein n=1 Tax=Paenibacillus woosongensis TaxID=307580 RepID=A0A7X2Z2M3_9BACL|nr:DUF4062 domain-containing protein [Paenibacillus woosongensis]MUG45746.1 DUF4062 domain-containing protein [Paenibacillus woosongensis]